MTPQRLRPFGTTVFSEMTALTLERNAINLSQGYMTPAGGSCRKEPPPRPRPNQPSSGPTATEVELTARLLGIESEMG